MAFPEKNYTLGRGRLFFDQFTPGTKVGTGQRYIGNTPELNLTSESESLDHYDSDGGIRQKDDSVLLQLSRTGSFITDHISPENLALFFLGDASVVTVVPEVGVLQTIADVKLGHRYQLGATVANPAGARKIENVVVTGFVLGTDYTLDAATGGIVPIVGGTIVEGASIDVTYDTAATSYDRIVTAANAEIAGSLLYVANNPKGANFDYFWPSVTLKPDGDFAIKGDEWVQVGFTFEALKKDDNTEVLYINGRGA